ncbi:MAG: OmpH family outer membrane protein [Planctomycetia bacterium]
MKRLPCFLAIVGLVLSTAVVSAQTNYRPPTNGSNQYGTRTTQPPRTTAPAVSSPAVSSTVAVIDLTRVFKQHPEFVSFQKEHEGAMKNLKARMDQENQTIQNLYKQMKELKVGSMRYTQIDSEITNRKAKFQADMELQEKQWLLRQAGMYHRVYSQVQSAIQQVAAPRGILMVLQTTDIPSDPERPATVKLNLEKEVVWSNRSVDITNSVIAAINPGPKPPYNNAGRSGATTR